MGPVLNLLEFEALVPRRVALASSRVGLALRLHLPLQAKHPLAVQSAARKLVMRRMSVRTMLAEELPSLRSARAMSKAVVSCLADEAPMATARTTDEETLMVLNVERVWVRERERVRVMVMVMAMVRVKEMAPRAAVALRARHHMQWREQILDQWQALLALRLHRVPIPRSRADPRSRPSAHLKHLG